MNTTMPQTKEQLKHKVKDMSLASWGRKEIELAEHDPARLVRESGLGSRDELRVRWIVRGTGVATHGRSYSGAELASLSKRPLRAIKKCLSGQQKDWK